MLDALFARWLKSGTPPSAPARPARLRLEPLEPREVPAADVWVGHTTDFTDPANWSDGLPTAEDELYFTGQVSGTSTTFHVGPKTYPGSGGEGGGVGVGMGGEGDPPGDGPPGGDGSWTYTFPDHYVGIYLEGGYAGVVSFPSDLTFNHYWQDTGATSNTAAGLTTTVTSNFFWAGGTLNAGAEGDFVLAGGTGLIAPTDGGTVDTDDTITLKGDDTTQLGSTLEIDPGTVNLNDGTGFVVEGGSLINFAPVPKADTSDVKGEIKLKGDTVDPINGLVKVDDDASVFVQPKDRPSNNIGKAVVKFEGPTPLLINFGRVNLKDRADIRFLVDDPNDPNATGAAGGVRQQKAAAAPGAPAPQDPVLKVEAGCFITCEKGTHVWIAQGTMELAERRDADGVPDDPQPAVTITAGANATALQIDQTATLKRADADPKKPLELDIKGANVSLDCTGTLELYAAKSEYVNDKIATDGRIVFHANSTVRMKWFDNAGAFPTTAPPWTLIESTYAGPQAAIAGTPMFDYTLAGPLDLVVAGISTDNKKYQAAPNS